MLYLTKRTKESVNNYLRNIKLKEMRYIIINLFSLLIYSFSFGQITKREIIEEAVLKPRCYDSLIAFNPNEDLRIYIGQELFFLPKSKKWKDFKESDTIGYSHFSNKPEDNLYLKEKQYHPIQSGQSDYNKIAGKYFIINDFIDKTDEKKFGYNEQGLYFKLVSKELRDTAYYQIAKFKAHLSDRMNIPFIVVGHFEKLRSNMIGKKLKSQETIKNVKEIKTGQKIDISKDTWWECIDFTLVDLENEIYSKPVFIFRNEKTEEIIVEANEYHTFLDVKRNTFFTLEEIEEQKRQEELQKQQSEARQKQEEEQRKKREMEWAEADKKFRQECISEFGLKYGNYIADGKVIIGMTKKMCLSAWGSPIDINTTTTSYGTKEQWVYSLKYYLYFENGKLIAIQN